jgi:MFS family permease
MLGNPIDKARRRAHNGAEGRLARSQNAVEERPVTQQAERVGTDRRYLIYLIVIATGGWALASYDFNLLVTALPTIAKDLDLSQTKVGLLAFLVYVAMLLISFAVGYCMDEFGRKVMWQVALLGAAVFTGLTYFVHTFWWLVVVRALASGLANSELAISITLVNEQVPAERRGLLYSIVQGGWPLGVLLASAVFLGFNNGLGVDWHIVFLFGVIPLLMVIVGRRWVRPSERYQQLRELREAKKRGDDERMDQLLERYDVDVEEIDEVSVRQLFAEPGWARRQLIRTSLVWVLYAAGFVAANTYIIDWLTKYRSFSRSDALALILVASGIGIGFYVLGGALGERYGRQRVLIASAFATLGLTIGFYFAGPTWLMWLLYVLLYQVSNGTWSGTGYAYWAESFPTRVRGTAIGWLGAMFATGLIVGAGVWTLLIGAEGAVTFLAVGAGFAVLQALSVLLLPNIKPGQELEEVAT